MNRLRGLIGKVGFTAIGVGVGLVFAAGSGAAAVHFSRTVASEHSISVVQSGSSHDGSVAEEDSSVSGADDTVPEAAEARQSGEPEPLDDRTSRPVSTSNSGPGSSQTVSTPTSPEPGDDHGRGGSSELGDDHGQDGAR